MVMFASDLDRTLIYSQKFINKGDEQVQLVEKKGDEKISYMLNSSIKMLKILSSKLLFVPVTTRSIEQYKRITVFQKEIKPKYSIVCNGGNIFIDGKLDENWNRTVFSNFNNECLNMNEVISEFNKIKSDLNIKMSREVDHLFFYCVLKGDIPNEIIHQFSAWLQKNNWNMVLNGRKLYFIPKPVSKNKAVEYVAKREGVKNIITSGDSLLDYDMASISNLFISPQHGDINKSRNIDKGIVKFTNKSGICASHEILEIVLKEII